MSNEELRINAVFITEVVDMSLRFYSGNRPYKKLSYRKQIARQLRTQYVEDIYSNSVTLKSGLEVIQGH